MDLNCFLKQNKKERPNVKFVASESFVDSKGKPIEWEIRPLKSREAENIRSECLKITDDRNTDFDSARYNRMVAVACVVFPDLNDKSLQDSYGVMGAEQLIQEMLDVDGDFQALIKKINEISGYNKSMNELVKEAKNS